MSVGSVVLLVLLAGCAGIGGVSGESYGSLADAQSDAPVPIPELGLSDEYSLAGGSVISGSYRFRYVNPIGNDVFYRVKPASSDRPFLDVSPDDASVETVDLGSGVTGYVHTQNGEDGNVEVSWRVDDAGYSVIGPVSDRDVLVTAAETGVRNLQ